METLQTLFTNGTYDKCFELAIKTLENNPEDFDALCYKGTCLAKLGRHVEAIDVLTGCISLKDDLFFLWVTRGDSFYELKDFSRAFSDYWVSLQHEATNGAVMDKCARALFLLGDEKFALDYIQRAIKVGESPEPVLVMINMLDRMKFPSYALSVARMGASKFPTEKRFVEIIKSR